jgi:polar amino acid transport system substrate-binding protein
MAPMCARKPISENKFSVPVTTVLPRAASAALIALVAILWSGLHVSAKSVASYTLAQAAGGAKLYSAQCSACHGAKLQGVTAPALRGGSVATKNGAEIYAFMSTQMPLTAPGSLKPDQYAALMAFLLKANGHPAGKTALTPASAQKIDSPL